MIRQAISCDICGTEKRQTNHWFVAYEQAGELRISGWKSRHRLRADAKHLCGQTCLHKLVDEYMAKCIDARAQRAAGNPEAQSAAVGDTSLTSTAAFAEPEPLRNQGPQKAPLASSDSEQDLRAWAGTSESSARLLASPAPIPPRPALPPQPEPVTMPLRSQPEEPPPIPVESRYNSRSWRAEAWDRERERELRAAENRPDIAARRRSHA